ncbi:MAG TPA: hypothetical protein VJP59_04345 [Gemmatimonadota bacterium]|nr:hypothetical protein [Gemmatimonadota bacterium]
MSAWAAIAGAVAVGAWLVLAPPWRDGLRGLLRIGAALLLLLGLFDVSCRLPSAAPSPRVNVLVDRSGSMELAGAGGISRGEAGRAWLDGEAFDRWTGGWEVEIDSFGGATSDPGAAVERASEERPDAVLVVSDGRVQGGRSIGDEGVPVFVLAPQPVAFPDAALLELGIEGDQDRERAVIEVASAGGLPIGAGRVEVSVDGRTVGRRDLPPLDAGERRVVRLPLPSSGSEPAVLVARVVVDGDPVAANDARSRIREPAGPRRALAVALGPTWDFAAWARALEASHPGPVDAFWSFPGGGLRPVDGGATASWGTLRVDRYAAAYLLGDPAALGAGGRAWIERFTAAGGRGLLWAPAGWRGELSGTGVAIAGVRPPAIPRLTPAGRAWLARLGAEPGSGPDAGVLWPPLEDLPASVGLPAGATVLLEAGDDPAAWITERGAERLAVVLGSGAYRWPLEREAEEGEGAEFWAAWSDGLVRWLAGASPAIRPLVRLPAGRAVSASEPLRASLMDEAGDVRWRIETGDRVVARGERAGSDTGSREIVAGPLPPGSYRLVVEAGGDRSASEPFVVETWSAEMAWTAADTGGLREAARRSGGAAVGPGEPGVPLPRRRPDEVRVAEVRRLDLGTWPWTFLGAAALVLADWALAARRRR